MEFQRSDNGPEKTSGSRMLLVFLLAILFISCILLFWTIKENFTPENDSQFTENSDSNKPKEESESLIPKNAKSPEDFMSQIETKAQEIQKKYDSNLTDFSRRKWTELTKKINGFNENFFNDGFVILSQEATKNSDQSVFFKIKYRAKTAQGEVENEDYFYLILSADKIKELGITDLKPDTFLTDDEIERHLGKEGFGKISRVTQ